MCYQEERIVLGQQLQRVSELSLQSLLHRSLVSLISLDQQGRQIAGTGVIISSNIVLTAAHNIYDRENQHEHSNIKLYAGAAGLAEELTQAQGWRYMEQYKKCSSSQKVVCDYAIVKLKKPLIFQEYLPLAQPCEICLPSDKDKQISIFGFSNRYGNFDLDQHSNKKKLHQYGLTCKNRVIQFDTSNFSIKYQISTFGGQSGCPVVVDNAIIAIHAGATTSQESNTGRIVESSLIETIQKWILQLGGSPMSVKKDSYCEHLAGKQIDVLNKSSQNLQQLNLSFYPNLKYLILKNNMIGKIDLSLCSQLQYLNLDQNRIEQINLNSNTHLTQLALQQNRLKSINLSQNVQLVFLSLRNNQLQELDCRENTKLQQLILNYNCLTSIDVAQNKELRGLFACGNDISTIDIHDNKKLTELMMNHNTIEQIDLEALDFLTRLWIDNNHLKKIKLSTSMLRYLDISTNQIQQIVIPICKQYIAEKVYTKNDGNNNYLFGKQKTKNCIIKLRYFQKRPIYGGLNESLYAQIQEIATYWKTKFSSDSCMYNYKLELDSFGMEL